MNIQIAQMTLRSQHLAVLPSEVSKHPDVVSVFGDATIQVETAHTIAFSELSHDNFLISSRTKSIIAKVLNINSYKLKNQASLINSSEKRQVYRLVGLNHEVTHWLEHTQLPPVDENYDREYDPADLFETERWIVNVSAAQTSYWCLFCSFFRSLLYRCLFLIRFLSRCGGHSSSRTAWVATRRCSSACRTPRYLPTQR